MAALGFDARLELLLGRGDELSRYRILHFGTHGLLNNRHPELSGILLSTVDENGAPQNGFLQMHHIYNLQLQADMVVLSSCETAIGKEFKGEGLAGLSRGFIYAGARRIVASLWAVHDASTSELMASFYRHLNIDKRSGRIGVRPARALRSAQLEMWRQRLWRSPYYWAGFVAQGDPN
jgi:CHAT domain-containing protein